MSPDDLKVKPTLDWNKKKKTEQIKVKKTHPSLKKNENLHGFVIAGTGTAGLIVGLYFGKSGMSMAKGIIIGAALGFGLVYLHRQKLMKDDEKNTK